jgi:hypothetical protein
MEEKILEGLMANCEVKEKKKKKKNWRKTGNISLEKTFSLSKILDSMKH